MTLLGQMRLLQQLNLQKKSWSHYHDILKSPNHTAAVTHSATVNLQYLFRVQKLTARPIKTFNMLTAQTHHKARYSSSCWNIGTACVYTLQQGTRYCDDDTSVMCKRWADKQC